MVEPCIPASYIKKFNHSDIYPNDKSFRISANTIKLVQELQSYAVENIGINLVQEDYSRSRLTEVHLKETISNIFGGKIVEFSEPWIQESIDNYVSFMANKQKGSPRTTKSSKAGLIFSPNHAKKMILPHIRCHNVTEKFLIGLTSFLEYLTGEMLFIGSYVTEENGINIIYPVHVERGIRDDEEMNDMFGDYLEELDVLTNFKSPKRYTAPPKLKSKPKKKGNVATPKKTKK
jgi:hypothetical protein